jgi:predicted methyltransferase
MVDPRVFAGRCSLTALTALGIALAGCATGPARVDPGTALSAQRIAAIVASPDRSAADRENDRRRKPEALLAFIGLRPGLVALDVSAGAGYTTELLARAIGPAGTVYGQSQPRSATRPVAPPAAPEGNRHPEAARPAAAIAAGASASAAASPAGSTSASPAAPARVPRTSPMALAERSQALRVAAVPAADIVAVSRSFDDPVPAELAAGGLDLVTLIFNYHDLGHMGVDRQRMNRALFDALKPGGHYVIADHAGRPGTGIGEAGTLHRIEEAFLRREVEAAGFRLVAEGDFLRNPADPRDQNTPNPPMPKDEFVLKFVKP